MAQYNSFHTISVTIRTEVIGRYLYYLPSVYCIADFEALLWIIETCTKLLSHLRYPQNEHCLNGICFCFPSKRVSVNLMQEAGSFHLKVKVNI
jgi:hypothetical protein